MRHSRVSFLTAIVIGLTMLLAPAVMGVTGDCDGNGMMNISDSVWLLQWLFAGGPPPVSFTDCDCDGFPGVNYGDATHITGMVFGGASGYPWPGSDLMAPSDLHISIVGSPGGTPVFVTRSTIWINNPSLLEGGMTLPFSFAPDPGEADLMCTAVTMGPAFGAIAPVIDNVNQTIMLSAGSVAATTGWVILCQADFALDPGGTGPGAAVCLDPTPVGAVFPLAVAKKAYDGINFTRMQFPNFGDKPGDVDCSGGISISDAVSIINYIFAGGRAPGCPCQ
jgi:hypothetical protein